MADSVPGLDLDKLLPWLREHVAPVSELSGRVIGHGRSNLTYRLEAGEKSWVLRRPPLSHVQPTAHDMSREFRVLSALVNTAVPVPRPLAFCDDPAVNGAPFYVMEYVDGYLPIDPEEVARRFDEGQRRRIGEELIDVLVRLHSLNPSEIRLGDFGRPQGYLERQVRRFTQQLAQARTRETPEMDELARRLAAAIPPERTAGIVHGDYRLDNTILDDSGHIVAVLDWEMSTLGDSMADVGMLRVFWGTTVSGYSAGLVTPTNLVMDLPGFPTWDEAAARYAELSGCDLSSLDFYIVFAHFKLGVILENMHRRFLAGGTVGPGFEEVGTRVPALASRGLAIADKSSLTALRG